MKKILVIENLVETRNFLIESLKAEGFSTIEADNGVLGVQTAQQQLPDLIISEITIPKLDGYSVLTILRENPATAIIPFIVVSTVVNRTHIRKAMELGADDYLTKPYSIEELLRAISARLERQTTFKNWYTRYKSTSEALKAVTTTTFSESIFPYDPLLSKVFQFIEANYHQPITLENVAAAVGYSSSYLTNLVKRQTGQTVQSWIITRRMIAACLLLIQTDATVNEIATQIGYQCLSHFFHQFRIRYGTTPQAWRKLQRTKNTQQPQKSEFYQ
ncbi:MAG: DNA-binding response regulator [Scytonema sp. PMC 1069.18]|nr:DNA-binding response regulator [Scytonema sp. PMC 1069.18]MEC4883324.1 DNA-binding response regulator [Scytonema sp. PMC 1070.18]